MQLPTERVPATRKSPRLLTLFGQSKVGKTTTLATLDDCLIIDTEQGTEMVEAMKVQANSLQDVIDNTTIEPSDWTKNSTNNNCGHLSDETKC